MESLHLAWQEKSVHIDEVNQPNFRRRVPQNYVDYRRIMSYSIECSSTGTGRKGGIQPILPLGLVSLFLVRKYGNLYDRIFHSRTGVVVAWLGMIGDLTHIRMRSVDLEQSGI